MSDDARPREKPVVWVGSSLKDLGAMPEDVKDEVGYVLHLVQQGGGHSSIKPLTGRDFSGVYEIRADYATDTYRAVYAVNLDDAIYVLHVSQKKSVRGIKTPKAELDVIRVRLKRAKESAEDERARRHEHHP